MSHELEEHIERRVFIVVSMPSAGLTPQDFLRLIMSVGYNLRGAKDKAKELHFLGLVETKEGKVYAVRT